MNFFWLIALLGSLVGGLIMVVTLSSSNGAPQEAAGAAIAVGFAVIPYCFARCLQSWKHSTSGYNAFWEHYAHCIPETPHARKFREGYGTGDPSYYILESDLYIRQHVSQKEVRICVTGRSGEDKKSVDTRLSPYWNCFEEAFPGITYNFEETFLGGSSHGKQGWCMTRKNFQKGTRRKESWDEMAEWLESQRQKYERILRS